MFGTSFAYVTTGIITPMFMGPPPVTPAVAALALAKAATIVGLFVYLCGLALSFFLPEPKGEALPE